MAVLPIRLYGDPVLRAKAKKVEKFDDELREFIASMIETMHAAEGIGLAAPQVGVSRALCVIDVGLIEEGQLPRAFINPVIHASSQETDVREEGCLSIPGITEDVRRPQGIRLSYQDEFGVEHELECQGLLARVLQHEIDHLHGVFFTDKLSSIKRKMLSKKLRNIARDAQKEKA